MTINYISVRFYCDSEGFSIGKLPWIVRIDDKPVGGKTIIKRFRFGTNASQYIRKNYPDSFVIWNNGVTEHT
jgi:hypothetical protein